MAGRLGSAGTVRWSLFRWPLHVVASRWSVHQAAGTDQPFLRKVTRRQSRGAAELRPELERGEPPASQRRSPTATCKPQAVWFPEVPKCPNHFLIAPILY